MMKMKFDLNETVKLVASEETGVVVGRAQNVSNQDEYLIRYRTAVGCQMKGWMAECDIEPLPRRGDKPLASGQDWEAMRSEMKSKSDEQKTV